MKRDAEWRGPRLPWVAVALALGGWACGSGHEPARERYNLLLVSFDTTRADHVSSYGYERSTTPNLDALAAEGHRFENAYTVMNTTLPSHAALFTSLPPASLGVLKNGDTLPEPADTLPERLRREGYATGGFVSAAPLHPSFGFSQGFDEYGTPPRRQQRKAEETVQSALAWLDGVGDEPSFTFVHFYDPHTMYDAPAEFRAAMGAGDLAQPVFRKFPHTLNGYDANFARSTVNSYDAEILYADHQLGVLLEGLEQRGLRERTIVAVFADHGESLEEFLECCNYLFSHGDFLSPHELRIPLVLWLPPSLEVEASRTYPELVSTLDVLPTLLELLDVPAEGLLEGRSLAGLLRGEPLKDATLVCAKHTNPKFKPDPLVEGGEWAVVRGDLMWIHSERRGEHYYRGGEAIEVDALDAALRDEFSEHLKSWREVHRAPLWGSGDGEIDPVLLEELRALGYF